MPATRNIIVIGASAGGLEAIRKIIKALPSRIDASIFIVWHMAAHVRGVLPGILNKDNQIYAAHAFDKELIEPNRIYIAPPDHHMLLEEGMVRITRGPKENRFRPAIDPLFRSAAQAYGPKVIGVILSGALDDGTSGLWSVKQQGGIAVVQHPFDAEVRSMPESAIREVSVDHVLPVAEMPKLLLQLSAEDISETKASAGTTEASQLTEMEVRIAGEDKAIKTGIMKFVEFTPFTCPECHGVLSRIYDGHRIRFRCHTGHAFSANALLATLTESVEEGLWNAIRGIDESVMLLNHLGDHYAEINQPKLAASYFKKANEAAVRSQLVRKVVFEHEQLSSDSLQQEAEAEPGSGENGTGISQASQPNES